MHASSRATSQIHFVSFLLAYALIISLFAPFAIKPAQASAVTKERVKTNAPPIDSANHEVPLNLSTPVFGKRGGELLASLRGGFSEYDKTTAGGPQLLNRMPWTANGGPTEKQLRGESAIEKLGMASGHYMEQATQESRLNPTVGSPNPSPFPTPEYGSGGTGPGGSFDTTPPQLTTGAAGKLPNLEDISKDEPEAPRASQRFQPYLVCADCDPQGGGGGGGYHPPNDPNFSGPRERPVNETGQPGVDLGSRNFNWSLPLVSLAGRAGLDLNLSIYYNSLVWTRDGSFIKYNADLGSPAPGFRLGLPILQQRFFNPQTGIWAYLMVTSSGGRVELRQVGSSNIYESQDGSYTQLDINNPAAPVVRTSDGTQLKFIPVTVNNEFRCVEIKDRNGNFISAAYNATNGHLESIVDTLGRTVTFVYYPDNNLQAIRQTWAGVAHDWATFNYDQVWVAPNFGGGLLVNGPNNNYVTVLTRVNLHDGSFYTFEYNTAFGQVKKINHFAPDTSLLSYTSYNVNASADQTDCPRFTERRDYGLYGVMNASAEVVTSYSVAGDGSWSQQTSPDGTIHKEFFHTSTWRSGLTSQTEDWSGGVRQKWTTISWTQDDEGLTYQKNPRVMETNVYDAAGNRRRTTINYVTVGLPEGVNCSLPYDVFEYAADGTTVLRHTYSEYYWTADYLNRHIIGLMGTQIVFDGAGNIQSKTARGYDWGGEYLQDTGAATQHDNSAYSGSFVTGRGNLSVLLRYDVSDPYNDSKATVTTSAYDANGSMIFTRDGLGHQNTFVYLDNWSDGSNHNSFAYPTQVRDGDGYWSYRQYNYDFGAVTRTQDPKGAVQTMTYDGAARILQITNAVNNAYIRWLYHAGMGYVLRYATIQGGAGEAYSGDFFDGWGKVRASASENPGSAGGYSAVHVMYDAMGRLVWRSNPTEINASWAPSGDDAAGWVWTQQSYDWQGRPLVTTNPDGSTRENIYGGCGCAGGEVTTVRDERGRRRRMTKDALGRLKQVEELNLNLSVYATSIYTYNARDQITGINQAGQVRSFVYDGHGRLQSRTTPEQGTTTYSYNPDDTINVMTDARGATTTFGYNNRHLVTSLTYGVPGGVAATPNVSFGYDAAGNRTSMNDGLGSVTYVYNTLSQMTSETRNFNGVGSYTLSYTYNLAGELASITNPWGAQVGYNYDKTGRATNVTGAGYAGVTSYVNSISYRAFAPKQVAYGNGRTLSLQYDNRMRMTRWDVPGVMG